MVSHSARWPCNTGSVKFAHYLSSQATRICWLVLWLQIGDSNDFCTFFIILSLWVSTGTARYLSILLLHACCVFCFTNWSDSCLIVSCRWLWSLLVTSIDLSVHLCLHITAPEGLCPVPPLLHPLIRLSPPSPPIHAQQIQRMGPNTKRHLSMFCRDVVWHIDLLQLFVF